ncbi:cobalt/nickel transport system ATP-binding protein [Caloramator quimbayensis]|uniref:Cobalt/nickel transport system ATP-binding protein n=1 Tax=Caloramator quimbayensis TaxID=1147123 RepID=A0A1T4WGA2_9CLOT|nr:ABC transporter ATP-binding protein [Caloramator quimbayensis]SKA76366.1 cobalt/nickel transport system ATP-binding protein [Caloramator quimbayensis]
MIELKSICFSYKDITALNNINLKIEKGESVALIGPNGCGKSTLLKLLSGIIFKSEGQYLFNGTLIDEKRMQDNIFSKTFHKNIGFLFQNPQLQLFCPTVYDEVSFGPYQMGFSKDEVQKRVFDCLNLLGIWDLRDRAPYNLSGGEMKKTALAAVLSVNPQVILLDEPMNGLDPKNKKFLRELLLRLSESGKTIICATHDFDYVKGLFYRAIVFSKEHTIIEDAPFESVVNNKALLERNNII